MQGSLSKLKSEWVEPVQYGLPIGDAVLNLNAYLGKRISFTYTGNIFCTHCGRKTKKSFNQGYCFPCLRSLAQCDICIIKPELCHFSEGTCRDAEWARQFCFHHHTVYLSNTSGIKVGITRNTQIPTRWIDQGAIQAIPVFQVDSRFTSGQIEVILGKYVSDKTRWQAMLKNQVDEQDMLVARDVLLAQCRLELNSLVELIGEDKISFLHNAEPISIQYPVLTYPIKVVSFNLDKKPEVDGTLLGIKGQYLLLDTGVINIRKYTGYEVNFSV